MSYFRFPDVSDHLVARFEIANVGKAVVHGVGQPAGPREKWKRGERDLLRLKHARTMVQGLLEGLEKDIAEVEAKMAQS